MCKNPKCIYVHPNIPHTSQLKWTAALANSTNLTSTNQADSDAKQESSLNNTSSANNQMLIA
jgi:hypothetical protein